MLCKDILVSHHRLYGICGMYTSVPFESYDQYLELRSDS